MFHAKIPKGAKTSGRLGFPEGSEGIQFSRRPLENLLFFLACLAREP
jgi:hypothetical protein